jgi:ABC-type Co2+ transport system permease subunit
MPKIWQNISRHWRDDANLVLGVWLFLSPWILQYSGMQMAAWNAWIMGVVVVLAAVAAILYFQEWEEYLAVLVAAWLVISPWALGFSATMMAVGNQIVVGVLVGLLAIWSAMAERQRDMQKAA